MKNRTIIELEPYERAKVLEELQSLDLTTKEHPKLIWIMNDLQDGCRRLAKG